jgi:hypothetical protein
MKTLLKITSILGLTLTVVPSFLVFYGIVEKTTHFKVMLFGAIMWFATSPFWMKNPSLDDAKEK